MKSVDSDVMKGRLAKEPGWLGRKFKPGAAAVAGGIGGAGESGGARVQAALQVQSGVGAEQVWPCSQEQTL